MNNIDKRNLDKAIKQLKEDGVSLNDDQDPEKSKGLGDSVEKVLNSIGVTQERFKSWFGLKGCNCDERKQWLNKIFPYGKK